MKTLENENEKVNRLCERFRKEALEPAEKEAFEIVLRAKTQADALIQQAKIEKEELFIQARALIEQEQKVFKSSLNQGIKQSLELLKQEIQKLFNKKLESFVVNKMKEPEIIAKIIEALISAVKNDGIVSDLKAYIPQDVSSEKVNQLLVSEVLDALGDEKIAFGNFKGGASIALQDKNLCLEMTDEAVSELICNYIGKDFRKLLFSA